MENLKQQAYCAIKQRIISCEFLPGTYLSEKLLMDALGLSRTPIRDALGRLEQEGLLVIHPKRGVWVADLTLGELSRLFEFRRLVELHAMTEHAHKLSRAALAALRADIDALETANREEAYAADDRFHDALVRSTDNEYMIRAYLSMRDQIHRMRALIGRIQPGGSRIDASRAEHLAILDAMLDGDWAAAASRLSDHLSNAYGSAFALLTQGSDISVSALVGTAHRPPR